MSDTEDTESYRKMNRGGKERKKQGLTPFDLCLGCYADRYKQCYA